MVSHDNQVLALDPAEAPHLEIERALLDLGFGQRRCSAQRADARRSACRLRAPGQRCHTGGEGEASVESARCIGLFLCQLQPITASTRSGHTCFVHNAKLLRALE